MFIILAVFKPRYLSLTLSLSLIISVIKIGIFFKVLGDNLQLNSSPNARDICKSQYLTNNCCG